MLHHTPSLVLASASPARRKLLQTAGIEPLICQSNFDETQIQLDDPVELVQTLAQCKATVVADRFDDVLILGCDSVLTVDNCIYGKPESPQMAIETLATNAWKPWNFIYRTRFTRSPDNTNKFCAVVLPKSILTGLAMHKLPPTLPVANPSTVRVVLLLKAKADYL